MVLFLARIMENGSGGIDCAGLLPLGKGAAWSVVTEAFQRQTMRPESGSGSYYSRDLLRLPNVPWTGIEDRLTKFTEFCMSVEDLFEMSAAIIRWTDLLG
jgi:hypothetical protein